MENLKVSDPPETLRTDGVCALLGCSVKTVNRYVKKGILKPAVADIGRGRAYEFKRSDVEALKERGPTAARTLKTDMSFAQESFRILTEELKIKNEQIANQQTMIDSLMKQNREWSGLMIEMQKKATPLLSSPDKKGQSDVQQSPASSSDQSQKPKDIQVSDSLNNDGQVMDKPSKSILKNVRTFFGLTS